jgi:hypothetical protein
MPNLRVDRKAEYRGRLSLRGPVVIRRDADGTETTLAPHRGVANLPEAEFAWSTDGEGADQLAFAILADAFGPEEATAFHVDFVFDVVADLEDKWDFTAGDVADWLEGYSDEWT